MNLLNHGLAEFAACLASFDGAARRPVYNPSPRQAQACSDMAGLIHAHVNSLLDTLLPAAAGGTSGGSGSIRSGGGGGALAAVAALDVRGLYDAAVQRFAEADRPFWDRFCATQMVTRHVDGLVAAAKAALQVAATAAPPAAPPASAARRVSRRSSMTSVSALAAELSKRTIALVGGVLGEGHPPGPGGPSPAGTPALVLSGAFAPGGAPTAGAGAGATGAGAGGSHGDSHGHAGGGYSHGVGHGAVLPATPVTSATPEPPLSLAASSGTGGLLPHRRGTRRSSIARTPGFMSAEVHHSGVVVGGVVPAPGLDPGHAHPGTPEMVLHAGGHGVWSPEGRSDTRASGIVPGGAHALGVVEEAEGSDSDEDGGAGGAGDHGHGGRPRRGSILVPRDTPLV
jgi:hypothetical protein